MARIPNPGLPDGDASSLAVRLYFEYILSDLYSVPSEEATEIAMKWRVGRGRELTRIDLKTYQGIFGIQAGTILYGHVWGDADNLFNEHDLTEELKVVSERISWLENGVPGYGSIRGCDPVSDSTTTKDGKAGKPKTDFLGLRPGRKFLLSESFKNVQILMRFSVILLYFFLAVTVFCGYGALQSDPAEDEATTKAIMACVAGAYFLLSYCIIYI